MLFVSSTHCLGVLILLLFVVCCSVRRLCGISVLPELVVHRRVCAQLHVEPLAVTRCPCVATVANVCPERMLAKASVCMGKGCFLCQ